MKSLRRLSILDILPATNFGPLAKNSNNNETNKQQILPARAIQDEYAKFRPRTAWGTSHTANGFPRATQCAACKNRVTKLRKSVFACHNFTKHKPPRNARMRATLGHFQTLHLRANSGQTESDGMADMIAAEAHGVSSSRL